MIPTEMLFVRQSFLISRPASARLSDKTKTPDGETGDKAVWRYVGLQ